MRTCYIFSTQTTPLPADAIGKRVSLSARPALLSSCVQAADPLSAPPACHLGTAMLAPFLPSSPRFTREPPCVPVPSTHRDPLTYGPLSKTRTPVRTIGPSLPHS